jgi:hypothetical protein
MHATRTVNTVITQGLYAGQLYIQATSTGRGTNPRCPVGLDGTQAMAVARPCGEYDKVSTAKQVPALIKAHAGLFLLFYVNTFTINKK